MECPRKKCEGSLRVVNSYRAGPGRITQRRTCDKCSLTKTTITQIDNSGRSARAIAKEKNDGI